MSKRRLGDRYELIDEIGEGGMGVVYRAHDPYLERDVAVKMVPSLRLNDKNRARFQREARLVAQMDHPAIVPIHDFGDHDGSLFFIMPLLEGVTLRQRIERRDLDLEECALIGARVADALAHSHARGVIHRDVKPENIMVEHDGAPGGETSLSTLRVRVMDFGLAWESTEQPLSQTGLIGTPAYLSPEQLEGVRVDARTDIYSLAVTLYECLAGAPPFEGALHSLLYRIGHDRPAPLGGRGLNADRDLERIVLRCLAKRPEQRPASARDLQGQLEAYLERRRHGQLDEEASASAFDHGWMPAELPLVGRDREWEALERQLAAVLDGECRMVLIGGDVGLGKSRLLVELEGLARARGVRVLHGRYSDLEESFPFQGLCDLIRDYFRISGSGSSTVGSSTTATVPPANGDDEVDLSDLAPELLLLFPVLSGIAPLRRAAGQRPAASEASSDTAGEDVAGEDVESRDKTYVFELLARTLIRLAGDRPAALMIENLHAAVASIEALRYILHRLSPTPTLIVGTFRPAEIDRGHPLKRLLKSLADDPRVESLRLAPLPRAQIHQLAEQLLGSGKLPESLAERLFEATEGNPLFIIEMMRSLRESNVLERDDAGVWQLTGDTALGARRLPETIQQAVESRIEGLPDDQRRLLTVAAVLGRSFEFDDLVELAGERGAVISKDVNSKDVDRDDLEDEVDGAVEQLIRRGILREGRQSRGDRLVFTSRLVRDLLYRDLPRRRRRLLHRKYARWLEERSAGRLERVYPLLVHHYSAGDVPEKTVEYGLKQARRALRAASVDDALRAARAALEFIEEDEVEDDPAMRGELLEIVARARRAQGLNSRALSDAERAVAAFTTAGDGRAATRMALLAAQTAWQGRQVDVARRWVDRGVEIARQAADEASLRRLLALGSTVANLRGERALARAYREEAERLAGGSETPFGSAARGVLRTVLATPVGPVDPALLESDEHSEVALMVFETLLGLDDEGHLTGGLCSDWESHEDGRRFVLTLRPAARFADGTRLRAGHVLDTFERLARLRVDPPVPALAPLAGREAFVRGGAPSIHGIEALSATDEEADRIVLRLDEPLPMYPALLTDPYTAVVHSPDGHNLVGTGPFVLQGHDAERLLLKRNPRYWRHAGPRLEAVELRVMPSGTDVAAAFLERSIDVARNMSLTELETVLRDPTLGQRLVEVTRRNVYFLLWNTSTTDAIVRRALNGVLRPSEMVWRNLGRFAEPAAGLVPPGLLGYDPDRRHPFVDREQAAAVIRKAPPAPLRVLVQPVLRERGKSLIDAIFAAWKDLGVDVEVMPCPADDFFRRSQAADGVDLLVGRWNGEPDPDCFTHGLFHSRDGVFRRYFSSPRTDEILVRGRRETDTAKRQTCYQAFEDELYREAAVLPLFHDVAYAIAGAGVRGLRMQSTPPLIDYNVLSKAASDDSPGSTGGGEIHVAVASAIESIDPVSGNFTDLMEVVPNVFESLTRVDDQARVVPWLAETIEASNDARSFRITLRDGVRFHDGRALTARDVRYSFERLLTTPDRSVHHLLLPIRGAVALKWGEADHLDGFQVLSARDLVLTLEEPLVFFPALLAHPSTAIMPEGTEAMGASWHDGAIGSGPFRVVRFESRQVLDLERNADYWRFGLPRCERLSFYFGIEPQRAVDDFRAGHLSLASTLTPTAVAELRRDPELARTYREAPRLSTVFVVLNARHGVLADRRIRRELLRRLALDAVVRETLKPHGTSAHGLIPPGLLGYEEPRGVPEPEPEPADLAGLRLKAAISPIFTGQYDAFWQRAVERLRAVGVKLDVVTENQVEAERRSREGSIDLFFYRWGADYPDPDTFTFSLLHSKEGLTSGMISSPELDHLCLRGRRETDPALRHAIYREIEDILVGEALLEPLFHVQSCHFAAPSVEGLRLSLGLPEVAYDELRVRR